MTAGDDLALALEGDRDGEVRQAVQEVGGAVERVDDPAVALVGAFDGAALLHDEAVAGPRLRQLLAQDLLRLAVGAETKSPGPLRETCRFSTSPKSRFRERDAFITASVITVMRGERIIGIGLAKTNSSVFRKSGYRFSVRKCGGFNLMWSMDHGRVCVKRGINGTGAQ